MKEMKIYRPLGANPSLEIVRSLDRCAPDIVKRMETHYLYHIT